MSGKPSVHIWTDGSVWREGPIKNPGIGGWAAVLAYHDTLKAIYGHTSDYVTNNVAEVLGAINALKALRSPCRVVLYTDSQYVINGIDALLRGTILKTNQAVWMQMLPQLQMHFVRTSHVDGHDTTLYNELCDSLAYRAAREGRSGSFRFDELQEGSEDAQLLQKIEKRVAGRERRHAAAAAAMAR